MAQDVINQLEELCSRLREQLMRQPEYRALVSLEKTIEDLSLYMNSSSAGAAFAQPSAPPTLDVNLADPETAIRHGADELADALVDALRSPKASPTARPADHLPSHRVA